MHPTHVVLLYCKQLSYESKKRYEQYINSGKNYEKNNTHYWNWINNHRSTK
jgi:hypothetical protein